MGSLLKVFNDTKTMNARFLLSGGDWSDVEVLFPLTGQSCSLRSNYNYPSRSHTMDGLTICGGYANPMYYNSTVCETFSSGEWVTSHTLVEERYAHCSWQTDQGVVLMGGGYSPYTSEIAPLGGGQSQPSFSMQHSTRWACSMPDLRWDSVIVTGGLDTMQTVSRYGTTGFVEDLPSLVVGRRYHGCGSYLRDSDGSQVLLVAGGYDGNNYLSSTEVLTTSSSGWSLTTPLPERLHNLRGVNSGGKLYLTGGKDEDIAGEWEKHRDSILVWLDEEQDWMEAGRMQSRRSNHAATTIQHDDPAMEHCS